MPNIEIKAACRSLAAAKTAAQRLNARYEGLLHQTDTYFKVPKGKLKLREIAPAGGAPKAAWLIPYSKTYEKRPARSDYQLLEARDPQGTKSLLAAIMGVDVVVDKTREVFLADNVRVHLDDVKGLGAFLEFEAVFQVDTAEARMREHAKVVELMRVFGVAREDLVTEGYADLLRRRTGSQEGWIERWARGRGWLKGLRRFCRRGRDAL